MLNLRSQATKYKELNHYDYFKTQLLYQLQLSSECRKKNFDKKTPNGYRFRRPDEKLIEKQQG